MTSGMIAGFILRKYKGLFKKLDKLISYVIYMLLFLLGLTVGQNDIIIKSFHFIGLKALLITIASVAGSLILSVLVFHIFFKHEHQDDPHIPKTSRRVLSSKLPGEAL
jgi:uncharacterized membrane protein YbjE (DUF340 family)